MSLKLFIHKYLTPRIALTRLVGCLTKRQIWGLEFIINTFVKAQGINMDESKYPASHFKTFNEFFTRELKDGIRPLASTDLVSPSEGKVTEFGNIEQGQLLQAKGVHYKVSELLAISEEEAKAYDNGSFFTIYLSPKDYHRVHMPIKGTLRKAVLVPGDLYSVNDAAINGISNLYSKNERMICYFDTEFGEVVHILVGATITGLIDTVWENAIHEPHAKTIVERDYSNLDTPIVLDKGAHMGAFLMGSTTVTIVKDHRIQFTDNVGNHKPIKVRESLGNIAK